MSKELMIQGWTIGELNALVKNLGGEKIARKIQRGEATVSLEEFSKTLFDKHGRRIPKGLQTNVCDANQNFRFNQPELEIDKHYADRISRLKRCLDVKIKITAKQFRIETERLLTLIQKNSQIAKIVNGVWLPVILPQLTTDDLGTVLKQYLEAVNKSYTQTFDDREFYNCREGTLVKKVNIVNGGRHEQLVERMKQGPVMGIHFPNPLQGFCIRASREQMSTLSEGFILSGMDTLIAVVMYPDVLAHDWNTPGLDLAALSWDSPSYSLFFKSDTDRSGFDFKDFNNNAANYSSGLLFIG